MYARVHQCANSTNVRARVCVFLIIHTHILVFWGDQMAISEARKKANDKWRDKFEEIRFRVPKGQKEIIVSHVEETNDSSVNAFLVRAVNETMERDRTKRN